MLKKLLLALIIVLVYIPLTAKTEEAAKYAQAHHIVVIQEGDTVLGLMNWSKNHIGYENVGIANISMACDLFRPLYDETNSGDGFVSLEVSPQLAHETEETINQAKSLWQRVNRPNLMVKIPATLEGIPAIRKSIADGININITLIFSLARYDKVMEAYLSGLEDRLEQGQLFVPIL